MRLDRKEALFFSELRKFFLSSQISYVLPLPKELAEKNEKRSFFLRNFEASEAG